MKHKICFQLLLAAPLLAAPLHAEAQLPSPDNTFLVACHRGDWRHFPENSIPSFESCIAMGADIIELDVRRTRDSVLVVCHDKSVDRTTDGKGFISSMTLAQIKSLRLKNLMNPKDTATVRMPTLREAFECCKGRIMINVDKGFDYYREVSLLADSLGMTDQVIIKSSKPAAKVMKTLSSDSNPLPYIQVVSLNTKASRKAIAEMLGSDFRPYGYEVCWKKRGINVSRHTKAIAATGAVIWLNSMWPGLSGRLSDNKALKSPNKVYGRMLSLGVYVIQTDRPEELLAYLRSLGRHK